MRYLVIGKNGPQVMDLNRRKAILERCRNCVGWNKAEVRRCNFTWCALHPYRTGIGKQNAAKRNKAIRQYCLQCCNDQLNEVRLCPCTDCSLFPYRHWDVDRSVEIESGTEKLHIEPSASANI